MIYAVAILVVLLAIAIGVAIYLSSSRVPEDPFITPRRHYSVENLQQLAGTVGSFFI